MQLTPSTAFLAAPTGGFQVADVVQPSRLFAMARARLVGAEATLAIGGPDGAPSAVHAVIAMSQLDSGINTLKSALVPTTPFHVRDRASMAIEHAKHATDLLRGYHSAVLDLGDGPLQRATMPTWAVSYLDAARQRLQGALLTIAAS